MGNVKEKYTKEYFLPRKDQKWGVLGIASFRQGKLRPVLFDLLFGINLMGKSVLSCGFGRGEEINFCLHMGAKKVVGIDFSPSAFKIASSFLERQGHSKARYSLLCEDMLDAYPHYALFSPFDTVLMLDFVEHTPRGELEEILCTLKGAVTNTANIIIHTPFYVKDNDILKEGVQVLDTSDLYEETQGMHCNRYSRESLEEFMNKCGYIKNSEYFWRKK